MRKLFLLLLTIVTLPTQSQVTTIANGNWNNAAIWSSATVPGNNTDVIINHIVTIISTSTARNITINNQLINNANILRVRGNLTNSGSYVDNFGTIRFRSSNTHNVTGTITTSNLIIDNVSTVGLNSKLVVKNIANVNGTLNSNGFLILYNDLINTGKLGVMNGLINGNFTSQIYVNRCNKWSYYSSPFNTTYDLLNDSSAGRMIYTGFPGSEYPSFPFINAYKYTTAVGYITPTNASDAINRGVGYTYWNSDTVFASPGPGIPQQWKMSTTGSINFSQNFTYALSYSPSDAWNLVGNPYPGTIDWRSTNWTKSNISTTIYLWNTCNQNWSTYNSTNGAGTNGGSRYVSPYQGFWVLTSNNSSSLIAPKSVIVNNGSSLLKPSAATLPPYSLLISTGRDESIISMDSSATDLYDEEYDAMLPDTSNYLYSIKGDKYIVNVIEYKNIDTVSIAVKNTGTLTFSGINTFSTHTLYLLDTQNLSSTLLTEGQTHAFSVNGVDENRFKIVFGQSLFVGIKTQTIDKRKRNLVKTIDIIGREVSPDTQGLILNIYDDGSVDKKVNQ